MNVTLFENERLELKREINNPKKLAIEIIALANSGGGRIGIGYDQKQQQVVGVDLSQKYEEFIANIIHDYCTPHIEYSISYQTIDNKQLLWINIYKSSAIPFHLKKHSLAEGTYIRLGSTTRKADQETLARLIREGKNISFDSQAVSRVIQLNQQRIADYLSKRQLRLGSNIPTINASLCEDLSLQTQRTATIAGCLLFYDQPQQLPELTDAYIKAARFKGLQKGLFLDQQEISGTLPDQIDHAVHFVLKNIRLQGVIQGSQRIDQYEYPPEILRELIVNAVIHRDYSISGSTIRIAIYDDRISVTSPGGLPIPVTVENITERQHNRNPIIAKRMFEMGYFDSWGQGMDNLVDWAKEHSPQPLVLDDSHQQFTVTLYAPGQAVIATPLYAIDQEILNYLTTHHQINTRTLQQNWSLTKSQAQTILKRLLDAGKIIRIGKGRSTQYRISAS